MARPEAIAVAGYYPTPPDLIAPIAALLSIAPADAYAVVDPCAGEGAAVCALVEAVFHKPLVPGDVKTRTSVELYTCEMEATRFKALEGQRGRGGFAWNRFHAIKGDAFRLSFSLTDPASHSNRRGASLLFLNPPYDRGIWEHRFLERFAPALADGGVLLFLVPYKALAVCASTLAREFKIAACYRFPGEHFAAYSQVVLVATKRPRLLVEDAAVRDRVLGWSKDPAGIPELPAFPEPCAVVPGFEGYRAGFGQWALAPVDITALRAKARPWFSTDRGGRLMPIAGILPDRPVHELLSPTYPVAMPPRAAHIAAGIAAGVFNGARIAPDDPASGLPEILVKGTFTRDFVTVEEKENKHGEVIGEVQVQQPELVVTVLDLRSLKYHTVASSTEVTGARSVEGMTTADLLAAYGRGLMKVMLAQCPVLHDPSNPAHVIPLPDLKRPLFKAQAHAVMAAVKLLGGLPTSRPSKGAARLQAIRAERRARRGKAAFILGEIGSGKSSIALATGKAIGARRVLVLCPPHLLQSWQDQAAAVLGDSARTAVLYNVLDVDRLAADTSEKPVVAILSRETAKLGHPWESVGPLCPSCGAPVPPGDLARLRACCAATRPIPAGFVAKCAYILGEALLAAFPGEPVIAGIFRSRIARSLTRPVPADAPEGFAADRAQAAWDRVRSSASMRRLVVRLLDRISKDEHERERDIFDAALYLMNAIGDDTIIEFFCEELYESTIHDPEPYGKGGTHRQWAREAALLLPPKGEAQERLYQHLFKLDLNKSYYGEGMTWDAWIAAREELASGNSVSAYRFKYYGFADDGRFTFYDHPRGSASSALAALEVLLKRATWKESEPCGEPLYSATEELVKDGETVQRVRRFPVATYIARKHPDLFDLLVLDEGHEYSGEGSAQGFAAHRLTALGLPTVILTGSVMNGYARSLFANQWAVDPEFRREFKRDEIGVFERRYGYIRQFVDFRDGGKKGDVERGTVTDRVEGGAKTIGSAPGVLPLFILRYLLRVAVTLHKSDLALELPVHRDVVAKVDLDAEMRKRFDTLQKALIARIRADRYSKDRAGKLWGQMAELPSYLDRATADTGNTEDGRYEIAYPESIGGNVVAVQDPFPASTILPKERWMLDTIKASLAEGVRVLVYAHHEVVLPRLARLIEAEFGWKKGGCPVLFAKKVAAGKRQEWIDQKVIAANRPVLVVNPIAVQTGLNNLVWFRRALWMQNPACNPIVKRQADGRIDRIGKLGETESIFPVYNGTAQETLHKLLMHKVGVSMATDGLDAESALAAAGVGGGGAFETLSIGRQLFEILSGESARIAVGRGKIEIRTTI